MPVPLARGLAAGGEALSRVIRRPPLLGSGQLTFLLWQARADSSRARSELGVEFTPLGGGHPAHRALDGRDRPDLTGRPVAKRSQAEDRPSARASAAQTRSTCCSPIAPKNGSASRRVEASSATGNCPSPKPNRSR